MKHRTRPGRRTSRLLLVLLLAVPAAGVFAGPAAAASSSWTGQGHTNSWTDPANWENGVPTADDTAVLRRLPGGPVTAEVPIGVRVARLVVDEGANVLGGSITVSGSLDWGGGYVTTQLELSTGSVSTIRQPLADLPAELAEGNRLVNRGTLTVTAGADLRIADTALLDNRGTLRLADGAQLASQRCCSELNSALVNSGRLEVGPGTAGLKSSTLDNTGEVAFIGGGSLRLTVAPSRLRDGSRLTGTGRFVVDEFSDVDLQGQITLSREITLALAYGVVTGDATVAGGTVEWTGSDIGAHLTTSPMTRLRISGSEEKDLTDGGTLTSRGAANITGSSTVRIGTFGARFTNAGRLVQTGPVRWTFRSCCTDPGVWENTGTFVNAVGPGRATLIEGLAVRNSGSVLLRSGTLATRLLDYRQTAGSTHLDGGSLEAIDGLVDIAGGVLGGRGLITGGVRNAGTVDPGDAHPGTLSVKGRYTQLAQGALDLTLTGSAVGQYDQLVVSGRDTLAGTLRVRLGSRFAPGSSSFAVLTAAAVQGRFSTTILPSPAWRVAYRPADVLVRLP